MRRPIVRGRANGCRGLHLADIRPRQHDGLPDRPVSVQTAFPSPVVDHVGRGRAAARHRRGLPACTRPVTACSFPVFSALPAGVIPAGNTPGSGPPVDGQFWNWLQGRKMQTSFRAATRRLQGTWRKGRRRSRNIHPALRRQIRQRGTGKRVSCSGVSVQETLMMEFGEARSEGFSTPHPSCRVGRRSCLELLA